MRQRNPDMEAYRDWQADRNDRDALQRYLLSMARDRELLDDLEEIVELDEIISRDDALRPTYTRVRPDYSNEATPFEEQRWRTLVDRYAGRQLDPRAVLILVEMGLRSGVPMIDVYRHLYHRSLIDTHIYLTILSIHENAGILAQDVITLGESGQNAAAAVPLLISLLRDSNIHMDDHICITTSLGSIGPYAASAVPYLIDIFQGNRFLPARHYYAWALGEIGPASYLAVPLLVQSLQNQNERPDVRSNSAAALGKIGQEAASSFPQLTHCLANDESARVRSQCAISLRQIGPIPAVIPQLTDSLRKDSAPSVRRVCALMLGQLGPAASEALLKLIEAFREDANLFVSTACRTAIEQITGEAPE